MCADPEFSDPAVPAVRRVPSDPPSEWASRRAELARLVQRYCLPYNEQLPWVPHAVEAAGRLIREHNIGALFSTSPPIASHLAALWIRRTYRLTWVADFRDPLAGNPFRTRRWLFHYDEPLQRHIFREAGAVTATTDTLAGQWKSAYPELQSKFHTIWNGFDPEGRIEPRPLVHRQRSVVAHVGNLYGGRHPGPILESLDRLILAGRLDPASILVRLVGPVEDNTFLRFRDVWRRLEQLGCAWAGRSTVPKEQADQEMAEADYQLILDLNETGANTQLPAKIFDCLLTERPVLACTNRGSPLSQILPETRIDHLCLYPDSPQEEADAAILRFLAPGPRRTRPCDWFWRQFDGIAQVGQLAGLLRSSSPNWGIGGLRDQPR